MKYKTFSIGDRVRISNTNFAPTPEVRGAKRNQRVFEVNAILLDWKGDLYYNLATKGVIFGANQKDSVGYRVPPNCLSGENSEIIKDEFIMVGDKVKLINIFIAKKYIVHNVHKLVKVDKHEHLRIGRIYEVCAVRSNIVTISFTAPNSCVYDYFLPYDCVIPV